MSLEKKVTAPYVMIVDDNPKNIQVLGTILKREGYRIGVAVNGIEALAQISKTVPDLILLDVMMPEMNGFEVCEKLKANDATKDVPVIFLTAKSTTEDIVNGFELGAVDYVAKPFNSSELLTRIQTHLDLKQKTDLLKAVSENQQQLIHVLCHDLTNPIHAILSFLSLIPDNEYADCMKLAANNSLRIIDIVRMISALQGGKLNLKLADINLREAVKESLKIIEHKYQQKEIDIKVTIGDNLLIRAEHTSLVNSVISNLITNAIKFSYPKDTIFVKAADAREHVILTIEDKGIGMSKLLLKVVFEIDKATKREGTGGESGTGFGMPLVKKFVEIYGATISVESKDIKKNKDNHGTKVTIKFQKVPAE